MKTALLPPLERAQGYLDLDMCPEAWAELRTLSRAEQGAVDAIHLKVSLLIKQKLWEEALALSRRLCELQPAAAGGYIQAAYCLHELGRTREASEFLQAGPPDLLEEPIYHYNLSCYQVSLGKFEHARFHLERSFELDERLVGIAENDPDLVPLWASL